MHLYNFYQIAYVLLGTNYELFECFDRKVPQ